jgi:hypothetical protein
MANVTPFFITGANCKLKVNGVTLAFATNLNYSVSVPHARAKMLGSYEANSFDPLSYDINGSFTIIRYIDGLKEKLESLGVNAPSGVDNKGNGIGSWTTQNSKNPLDKAFGYGADGRADRSLNPASLQDGVTFDIEVYQKLPDDGFLGVSRLRNVRITQMSSQLSKRGNMMQTFQFIAQFLDEDSFIAESSSFV